jgi:catecholate siderophore receptor
MRLTALALLVLACIAAPSWAADEEDRDDGGGHVETDAASFVEYVEVVADSSLPKSNTVAFKLDLPLQLTPANVGTVGAPMLFEQNARNLGDALRNVSGLNVQDGSGVHDYFAIRGFDSVSSGLVLTDGASEPEVSYYQMYNVQGVEVFKGPAGFLYGKNPLAGVVNLVRKQPLPGDFLAFNGSYGSFGTAEGTVDWNASRSDGTLDFRLNGLWRESDGYRDRTDSRHLAVNPSLTWRPDPRRTLNVNFEFVDAEYAPDNGLPLVDGAIPGVSRKTSYQSLDDFSEQQTGRV